MQQETLKINDQEYVIRELLYFEYADAAKNGSAPVEPTKLMQNILAITVSKDGKPIGDDIVKLPFTAYMKLVDLANKLHGWTEEPAADQD